MRSKWILPGICVAFAAALGFSAATLKLPPPFATPSVRNGPTVIPKPSEARLEMPAGFQIEVYAEGFQTPRFMTLGPNNEVLISDSARRPEGAVYVLQGKNKKKILSNLNRPYGLAFWNGYLYVGEPESIKRYKYDPKTMTAEGGQEVVSLAGIGDGHWTRTLLFDGAGKKLYVAVGSASNNSTGEDPRRAAINRYNPDGSGHEIFASGLRNPIGMRWRPGTEELWAAVQERDTLGDDLVPDFFTRVQQGGFYGWPYAYIGPHEDPMNKGKAPEIVAKSIAPDVLLGSHVAVLDFIFYTGSQFPAEYRGGAFLAYHGSWNRSKRVGQSIAFIPFQNGKPSGPPREVVNGWMISPDRREVWGRPVGLLQMPDGSVLISEDGGKKIFQLSYRK